MDLAWGLRVLQHSLPPCCPQNPHEASLEFVTMNEKEKREKRIRKNERKKEDEEDKRNEDDEHPFSHDPESTPG